VFRPYFSTKGAAGTGLGLAIVSGVVTGNRGAVSLTTQPAAGAAFRVLLPATTTAIQPTTASQRDEALTGRLDGRAILVVDDDEDVLAVLAALLEHAGAEVAPCSDPRDALEAVQDDPDAWDLLITDFDMAPMTGADLARAARSAAPGLPILLVTALPDWGGRGDSDEGLFVQVLGKPVTPSALVAAAEAAKHPPSKG